MRSISRLVIPLLLVPGAGGDALAEGYILGGVIAGDSADGRGASIFGDFGVADHTWISGTFGTTETRSIFGNFNTRFADVGIDHYFEPLGIRLSSAYWGDSDILDSIDVRASVYYRNDRASIAADYERRNFDFIFGTDLLDGARKAEFEADGAGLTGRIDIGNSATFRATGMVYNYSRDIRLQRNIDTVRFLSASQLSLINSLLDHRFSAGLEYRFGLRSVEVSVGGWKTAVDQSNVESYAIGFVTPLSNRTDIGFRLSVADSENFGKTTALTIYLYYFGGV